VLLANTAQARQWELLPVGELRGGYDDNVRLSAGDKESSFVVVPRAGARLVRTTETSEVDLGAEFFVERYTDVPRLNNEGGFLRLSSNYAAPRTRYRLLAAFDTESTLTSEIETSGLVQVNKQRYRFSLIPGLTYRLSERSDFDVRLNFQDVSYEDVDTIPLFDYTVVSGSLGYGFRVSERAALFAQADYGEYEASGTSRNYDNLGAELGVRYLLSETSELTGSAGLRRTKEQFESSSGDDVTDRGTAPTFAVGFSKRMERGGSLSADAVRNLLPSGTGDLLDTTRLNLRAVVPLSERWKVSLDSKAFRNRQANGQADAQDRKYAMAGLSLSYDLSPEIGIAAGYRYRWQERNGVPGDADSNAVFVTLSWNPRREAFPDRELRLDPIFGRRIGY
jgi:hypothetical protein